MRRVARSGTRRACARAGLWLGAACLLAACSEESPQLRSGELSDAPNVTQVPAPVAAAHCDVDVEGTGILDLEIDYLPNVVRCENGGANLEALKAQAIAARSVAYYAMETEGSICDSQGCQVFSCGGQAEAIHIQAVEETSGMYLKYGDVLTYGFYVAGDPGVQPAACIGAPDGGPTEHYVTYNDGKTGTDVEQTDLGFVFPTTDSGYGQNRGCMSQWSARCLENDNGVDYLGILRFFYGDDIEIVQAEGECVLDVEPPGGSEGGDSGGSDAGGSADAADDMGGTDPGDGADPPDGGGVDDADGGSGVVDDAGDLDDGDDGQGTAGGGDAGALPETFGGDLNPESACACTQSSRPAFDAFALGLLGLLGLRRRKPSIIAARP